MGIPCYGLHEGYDQLVLSAYTQHDVCVPPPVKVPCVPHIIEPATMGWFGGMVVTHKVGKKTYFDGKPAVQQGHDCGYLIPHFGPPNALLAVHILFSKHKVMFPVSKVLIENKALGSYLIAFLGLICSQVLSLPTGVVIPIRCTVFASMSALDVFLGLLFIGIDMIIDKLWDKFGKGVSNKIASTISSKIAKSAIEAAAKATANQASKLLLGKVPGFLARQIAAKVIDHLAKSWAAGPIAQGLPFLPIHIRDKVVGDKHQELPTVGIGRGNITKITFFPQKSHTTGN